MKNFYKQIINTCNSVNSDIETLKNDRIAIVVYGAGKYALLIEKFLAQYGLTVSAFYVDDKCVNSKDNLIHTATTFLKITKLFNTFSVVIGNVQALTDRSTWPDKKEIGNLKKVYKFDCFFLEAFSHFNHKFIYNHITEFETVYSSLSDEQSRDTYTGFINTKITHNSKFLGTYHEDQYFVDNIVKIYDNEIFVDGGAYTGDTLLSFIKKVKGKFAKYYAFEPDHENAKKLKNYIKRFDSSQIKFMEMGLWNKYDILKFTSERTDSSKISEYGDKEIIVDSIDNLCNDATFIKLDIEGAELEAIKGAAKTITSNRPKLAVCIYHKPEHLYEIPLYLKTLYPDYKLYIRQHGFGTSRELVLYAIN